MAIKALNLHDLKDVVHPNDTDGDPTIWTIGAVDSRVFGQLTDRSLTVAVNPDNPDADADVKLAQNQLAFEVVQFGLRGFKNFGDTKGDVKYETERKTVGSRAYEVCKSDILRSIPGHVLQWLSKEIRALNALGVEEGNG